MNTLQTYSSNPGREPGNHPVAVKRRTFNIEHSTPNTQCPAGLDVECSMLNVRCFQNHRLVGVLLVAALLLVLTSLAMAQSTNAVSRLDYNSFRMISDRNIFNPSRYARGSTRSTTRTESSPASRVESFTLVGLMAYEKGVFAFFDGTSGDYKKTLEANGNISEFKVVGISPDDLKLASGTNEFVMHVGMQVRREDEGDWFLTEATQTTRNRVVVSRGRSSRSSTDEAHEDVTAGVFDAGMEVEPPVIILEPEPQSEASPANGNGAHADDGSGITDPVLLRLMQRRQELSQ